MDHRANRTRGRPGGASGVFGVPLRRLRSILRACHLAFGMLLVPYVYSPLGDVAAFELLVRVALVPLTIFTGIAMWQQARWRKLFAKREA